MQFLLLPRTCKLFIALQFCTPLYIFGNLKPECLADLTSLTKCHKVDVYTVQTIKVIEPGKSQVQSPSNSSFTV